MDSFYAMFWDNNVYVNKKHQYLNNEILVRYLNLASGKLEESYEELRYMARRVLLSSDMSIDTAEYEYDDRVWEIQRILKKLDRIYLSLPPYDVCGDKQKNYKDYGDQLVKCLNRHSRFFEDGAESDPNGEGLIYKAKNEYGYLTYNEKGRKIFWRTRFNAKPMLDMWDDRDYNKKELRFEMEAANKDIENTIGQYLYWLEDVLRVKYVYAKLLDEFYHIRHAFLNEHEAAAQFEEYLKTEKPASRPFRYLDVAAEPQAVSHEVFRPENGKPIICDSYRFNRLGALLYTDFFRGLKSNYIPKKCDNCGKWFLLPFGKYSDYCENPLPDDTGKTCRDISARKKYDDKCRTDPVWLAYNRAYKAHYARYMKKKMTNAEFEKWGTYAIELRSQALDGALKFEEYERLIKI